MHPRGTRATMKKTLTTILFCVGFIAPLVPILYLSLHWHVYFRKASVALPIAALTVEAIVDGFLNHSSVQSFTPPTFLGEELSAEVSSAILIQPDSMLYSVCLGSFSDKIDSKAKCLSDTAEAINRTMEALPLRNKIFLMSKVRISLILVLDHFHSSPASEHLLTSTVAFLFNQLQDLEPYLDIEIVSRRVYGANWRRYYRLSEDESFVYLTSQDISDGSVDMDRLEDSVELNACDTCHAFVIALYIPGVVLAPNTSEISKSSYLPLYLFTDDDQARHTARHTAAHLSRIATTATVNAQLSLIVVNNPSDWQSTLWDVIAVTRRQLGLRPLSPAWHTDSLQKINQLYHRATSVVVVTPAGVSLENVPQWLEEPLSIQQISPIDPHASTQWTFIPCTPTQNRTCHSPRRSVITIHDEFSFLVGTLLSSHAKCVENVAVSSHITHKQHMYSRMEADVEYIQYVLNGVSQAVYASGSGRGLTSLELDHFEVCSDVSLSHTRTNDPLRSLHVLVACTRKVLRMSERILTDPSPVTASSFPVEQVLAILTPFWFPLLVPLLRSLKKGATPPGQ